jgi:hypothetical protein
MVTEAPMVSGDGYIFGYLAGPRARRAEAGA